MSLTTSIPAAAPVLPSRSAAASACDSCLRSGQCLGAALHDAAKAQNRPDGIHVQSLQRGQTLYRIGEATTAVYVVQSGALKLRRHSAAGDEEIIAFRQPGDASGLESLGHGLHTNEAVALGPTRVCRLPASHFKQVMQQSPDLADRLFDDMSREFARLQHRLQLERLSAPARVASYLIGQLEHRRELFGNAIDSFSLPMSRIDLGRFLALAAETVSRVFARLQQDGVIASEGHTVRVLDEAALRHWIEQLDPRDTPMRRAA